MSGSVGRLTAVVYLVSRKMVRELRKNQFFNNRGDKGKIRDRAIVLSSFSSSFFNIFFYFEERCNKSSFENFRKDTRG